ncbi:hypothetical protein L1987_05490 [Smallanthus sonchifolius]|uniref:Uncharacterized protein n=1 Tax=Smallanthus sonchifolius TaxID=185202 RepID=A0ACB9JVS2_9ASTR|nr:hypothetical protein L1987_05490 [Smallanthus sonchifolius]
MNLSSIHPNLELQDSCFNNRVEKMKEIAKQKANEERRKLESEVIIFYGHPKINKTRIKEEWDLALINVLTVTACNAIVVWSLAPCRSYGNTFRFDLQNTLSVTTPTVSTNALGIMKAQLGETSRLAWLGVEVDPLAHSDDLLKQAYNQPSETTTNTSPRWFISKNPVTSGLGFKQDQSQTTTEGGSPPPPPKACRKRIVRKKVTT